MAIKKRRCKAYTGRWDPASVKLKTQPWRVAAVLNPVIAIIDQLEQHGTIDETTRGQAVFKNMDGHWYDTHASLTGFVETFELHEKRTGRSLELDPLRKFSNKLKYSMPVFQEDTTAARACLDRVKLEILEMTAGYASALIADYKKQEGISAVST